VISEPALQFGPSFSVLLTQFPCLLQPLLAKCPELLANDGPLRVVGALQLLLQRILLCQISPGVQLETIYPRPDLRRESRPLGRSGRTVATDETLASTAVGRSGTITVPLRMGSLAVVWAAAVKMVTRIAVPPAIRFLERFINSNESGSLPDNFFIAHYHKNTPSSMANGKYHTKPSFFPFC